MKKIFLTILILTSIVQNSLQAQEKFRVGLKAGINLSDFTGRAPENYEVIYRTSYHAGF